MKIELEIIDELIPGGYAEKKKESQELKARIDLISERVEGIRSMQSDLLEVKNMMRLILSTLREVECPLCLKKVKSSSINRQCSQVLFYYYCNEVLYI